MLKKISLYLTSFILAFTLIGSAYAVTLKASHQWPGTPRADGSFDPRHEMVQIIADEVKKANVGIDIRIYPAKALYKPKGIEYDFNYMNFIKWSFRNIFYCHITAKVFIYIINNQISRIQKHKF